MATIKLKLEIESSPTIVRINVIKSAQDSINEVALPNTDTNVEIEEGKAYVAYINILSAPKATFKLHQDDEVIFQDSLNEKGIFANYIFISA